jgi:hypothetical protein
MILTIEERIKFAAYLEEDARSNELLAEQMEKLPNAAILQLAREKKFLAVASRLVAKELRAGETFEVKK